VNLNCIHIQETTYSLHLVQVNAVFFIRSDVFRCTDFIFLCSHTAPMILYEAAPNRERFIYKKKDTVPVLQFGKTWYEF